MIRCYYSSIFIDQQMEESPQDAEFEPAVVQDISENDSSADATVEGAAHDEDNDMSLNDSVVVASGTTTSTVEAEVEPSTSAVISDTHDGHAHIQTAVSSLRLSDASAATPPQPSSATEEEVQRLSVSPPKQKPMSMFRGSWQANVSAPNSRPSSRKSSNAAVSTTSTNAIAAPPSHKAIEPAHIRSISNASSSSTSSTASVEVECHMEPAVEAVSVAVTKPSSAHRARPKRAVKSASQPKLIKVTSAKPVIRRRPSGSKMQPAGAVKAKRISSLKNTSDAPVKAITNRLTQPTASSRARSRTRRPDVTGTTGMRTHSRNSSASSIKSRGASPSASGNAVRRGRSRTRSSSRSRFDAPTASSRARSVERSHSHAMNTAKRTNQRSVKAHAAMSGTNAIIARSKIRKDAPKAAKAKHFVRTHKAPAAIAKAARDLVASGRAQPIPDAVVRLATSHTSASQAKVRSVEPPIKRVQRTDSHGRPLITQPESPKLQTANRISAKETLSTEDRLLMEIEANKKEMAQQRQQNAIKLQQALQSGGTVLPCRSTKPLTQPQEFCLFTATRSRSRSRSRSGASTPTGHRSRSASGRSSRGSSSARRPQSARSRRSMSLTKPMPFNFRTDVRSRSSSRSSSRRSSRESSRASSPVADIVGIDKLLMRTDDVDAAVASSSHRSGRSRSNSITVAKSPQFATSQRKRNQDRVMSTAEREEAEMKSFPSFKAREWNEDIMHSSGDIGVPRVKKRPPTHFHEFNLHTDARARSRPVTPREEEQAVQFKARPVDPAMFAAKPRSRRSNRPVTNPVSPNITKSSKPTKRKSPEFVFKARPVPQSKPFKPAPSKRAKTKPQPFDLNTEQRGTLHEQQLQERLQMEQERARQMAEFKAQPVSEAAPLVPRPSKRPLTEPKPFKLKSVELSEYASRKNAEAVARERAAELERANSFKARPFKAQNATFLVKKSTKPLTEVQEFDLFSEHRAIERSEFEDRNQSRIREAEKRRQQEAAEKEQQEQIAIQEMRKTMVPKAQPIRHYKSGPTEPIEARPLTQPVSPMLRTKQRSAVRAVSQLSDENTASNMNVDHAPNADERTDMRVF
jgi:Targeting protein for Xklp2 (TPX2) domain/Cell cycle regulated microtubule associated protein